MKIKIGSRQFDLPRSRLARVSIGIGLILAGLFGFLPVVGFWMLPLGLLVLAVDVPLVRRLRRRLLIWWYKDRLKSSRMKRNE